MLKGKVMGTRRKRTILPREEDKRLHEIGLEKKYLHQMGSLRMINETKEKLHATLHSNKATITVAPLKFMEKKNGNEGKSR
jgi:hypothetical protein